MNPADILNLLPEVLESDTERFRVLSVLGQGGMGIVFKARSEGLDRDVAIKMLNPQNTGDTQTMQRLRLEALAATKFDHPNVVKVYNLGMHCELPFIVMEYVEGRTLTEILEERERLALAEFYDIFRQLLDALDCIHNAGFMHRDIKPSNILVTTGGIAKLMDFGIVKQLETVTEQRVTQTGAMVGSPWYMSPEQCAAGAIDARSDIYSVGCTMYQALSGKPPFGGENTLEVMYKHLHEQADTLSGAVDPKIADVVAKAMSKDPTQRFQSAQEFKEALHSCRTGDYNVISRSRKSKRGKPPKLVLLLSCAAFIAVCIAAPFTQQLFRVQERGIPLNTALIRAHELQLQIEDQDHTSPEVSTTPLWKEKANILQEALANDKGSPDPFTRLVALKERAGAISRFDLQGARQPYLDLFAAIAQVDDGHAEDKMEAYTHVATYFADQNDPAQFDKALAEALRYAQNRYRGANKPAKIGTLARLQMHFERYKRGDKARAEAFGKEAIALFDKAGFQYKYEMAQARENLGTLLSEQARWAELARFMEESIPLSERNIQFQYFVGTEHESQCMLAARAYANLGNRAKSETFFNQALRTCSATNPPIGADTRAYAWYLQSINLETLGDHAAALAYCEKALEVCRTDPKVLKGDMGIMIQGRLAQLKVKPKRKI